MRPRYCLTSGKASHATYAAALAEFDRLVAAGILHPERGSIYRCTSESCQAWHLSKRLFTLTRRKGRGKRRKGLVRRAA